jgi:cytochrome P450
VHGGDDLISDLIRVRDSDDGRLSEAELRRTCTGLIVAGNETTVSAISLGSLALIRHPDQLALLRERPELIERTVEEVLRHQALSDGGLLRVATEDLELAGVAIAKGDAVLASPSAANRDERHFADPDAFDISRTGNPHLAFIAGPHFCLGAALARVEMRIAIGTLARRLPEVRLAVPEAEIHWRRGVLIGGPQALLVTW